ncbi:MAG: hypothetical protein Q9172_006704, partial [Xanthocarpia lactea]
MQTSTPQNISTTASPIPLSFGIELEHVLAFHSTLLAPLLPANNRIIRHIPYQKRLRLRQTTSLYQRTRPSYHSWGVTTATTYPSPFEADWHNRCLAELGYRGYADEILRMEQQIFLNHEKEVVVHDGCGKMQKFGKWYLTTDTSLVGARPKELAAIVKDDAVKPREWDSGPVELVSRVLDVDDEASFQEIGEMFGILTAGAKARRRYRAFTDQWCGLHVHIGLPTTSIRSSKIASESKDHINSEDNTIPLPVLQHLAYITVVNEPIISLLHPPNRRPSHANAKTDLLGNRDEFFAEPDYSRIDWDLISLNYDSQSDSGYNSGCGSGGSYAEATLKFPGPDSKCWKKKKGRKAEKKN